MPVIGAIHPWQSVFLAVGLPGLVIAALLFTVREPRRREQEHQLPVAALVRWVAANKRTYIAHSFGFATSSLVNIGLAFWLPASSDAPTICPRRRRGRPRVCSR